MPPFGLSQIPGMQAVLGNTSSTLPLLVPPVGGNIPTVAPAVPGMAPATTPQTSSGQFVSPEEIALRQRRADAFTAQSARAPNPIAAALLGFQGGFGGSRAQRELAGNRALTAETLDQLRTAPSGGVSRILLGSPDPKFVLAGINQRAQEEARRSAASLARDKLALEREKLNQDPTVIRSLEIAGLRRGTPEFENALLQSLRRGTNIFTGDVSDINKIEGLGDKKFAETAASKLTDRFDAFAKAGELARQREADLNFLSDAVISANTNSLAGIRTSIQGVANAFGINTDEFGNLADAEAIESIVKRVAPTLRQAGSGAQSDIEYKGFLASLPGLTTSIQGNKLIISILRKMGERSRKIGNISDRALIGEISRKQAIKEIRAVPTAIGRKMARTMRWLAKNNQEINDNPGRFAIHPDTGEMRRLNENGEWEVFNP